MNSVIKVTFMRKQYKFFEEEWRHSQTVLEMKTQISEKINVPVDNQILMYDGYQLQDEHTREQCGISDDGSRVQFLLATDTVAIKVVWGNERIVVHVNVLSTIQYVKAQMIPRIETVYPDDPDFSEERADPNLFDLYLNGRWLNQNSTVLDVLLKDDDEVLVLKRNRVELTVNDTGQTWLLVNRMLTFAEFKQQLNRELGIPLYAIIHLVGHGDMANDSQPLFLYGIEDGSRLIATFHPPPPTPLDFTHLLQ